MVLPREASVSSIGAATTTRNLGWRKKAAALGKSRSASGHAQGSGKLVGKIGLGIRTEEAADLDPLATRDQSETLGTEFLVLLALESDPMRREPPFQPSAAWRNLGELQFERR